MIKFIFNIKAMRNCLEFKNQNITNQKRILKFLVQNDIEFGENIDEQSFITTIKLEKSS